MPVHVVKPNKSIGICGDFRLTVNQVFKTEKYPLPKIEDIHVLASVAGGGVGWGGGGGKVYQVRFE